MTLKLWKVGVLLAAPVIASNHFGLGTVTEWVAIVLLAATLLSIAAASEAIVSGRNNGE